MPFGDFFLKNCLKSEYRELFRLEIRICFAKRTQQYFDGRKLFFCDHKDSYRTVFRQTAFQPEFMLRNCVNSVADPAYTEYWSIW